jgi:hypothetical protein
MILLHITIKKTYRLPILGSRGIDPKKGTFISWHIFLAPPAEGAKIIDSFVHLGQTNPLMFSMTPIILTPTFLQKLISFLTSCIAISCGVVTMTAP